ncbi:ABC transporter permease [Desulfospira joergensenii]|uniref:ABC transporter permease n=1 Tax=Desulfospira joergensenii TaxID=53329 RepID=UPI0003B720FC|nr:ABC transporter permease [Desulfospira joergensenii]
MGRLTRYLAAKLGRMAFIMALVCTLAFTLVSMAPLDPVSAYLGYDRMQISPAQEKRIIQRWGLDRPPAERFARWTVNLASGNMGTSVIYNEPVVQVIAKRFSASLILMALAWTFSGILGFFMGIAAGAFPGSLLDRAIRLYAYTLASAPTFWIAMILLIVLSVNLGWFPVCCAGPLGMPPESVSFLERLHHLMLPAFTLSVIGIAQIALHTREKMVEVFHSDFALYAKALGESRLGITFFHGLRHTLLPALTLQFAGFGELFGGAVLAEQVFSYPGLGQATVEAGVRGDVPLLLGIVLFSSLFVISGNMMADLLYLAVDPRIRAREGE